MVVRTLRPWVAALLLVSPIAAMAQQEVVAPAGPPAAEPVTPMPPAAAPFRTVRRVICSFIRLTPYSTFFNDTWHRQPVTGPG